MNKIFAAYSRTTAIALVLFSAIPGIAWAQTVVQPAPTTGPLSKVAAAEQSLHVSGIDITGYYEGNLYATVSGGVKQTAVYFSDLAFGAKFDLAKLAGISGAQIAFSIDSRFGGFPQGVNDLTGSSVGFLGGAGPDNQTRLNELTFSQKLAGGKFSYVFGRTTLANYFGTSDLYCQFETSLCSNLVPFNWSADSNEPFYPIAVWGGEVEINPTPRTYMRLGVSESNPSQYSDGGFPWNDGWSFKGATGAFVPVELGYSTETDGSKMPGRYDVGFYYDSSNFADARYNADGGRLAATGGNPALDGAQSVIYLQAEQVLWQDGARKFWGFAAGQFAVEGHAPVASYYQLGAVMQGTFPGRDHDTAGISAAYYVFNPRVTGALDDVIAANGGGGHISNTEEIFEANYGIAVWHGITLKPYIDVTLNPDQFLFDLPTPNPSIRHAVAVGTTLSFGF
jgi:porin